MTDTFQSIGIVPKLVQALTALGYEEPTPIQRAAIPPLLVGRDILAQAATGTGKTAAFALPLLQRLPNKAPTPSCPAVLVLTPTRELAVQVSEAFHRYGREFGALTVPIYGGQEFGSQIRILRRGVHVVVATPGRALDHLRRGTLDLSGLTSVVLDEADEMLDMGFAEEIESILEATPEGRQMALFSATMAPRIAKIAEKHLHDPVKVLVAHESGTAGTMPKVRQTAYVVHRAQKVQALGRVLDLENPTLALIFCRTRHEVDQLAESLGGRGFQVEALHGGMTQPQRDRVMKRTRAGKVDILVATDVAARGLDIEQISHVVNFNVPESPAAYVHRIGRTGRAGREGVAVTLVEPREHRMIRSIEQLTRQRLDLAQLPTVMDVRAKQLEVTRASLVEALVAGQLDGYRVIVDALSSEYDLVEIATAAVKLAHEAAGGTKESDEPELVAPVVPSASGARKKEKKGSGEATTKRPASAGRQRPHGMARIYIGAGRKDNMRPADLVGAIINEAQVDPKQIGAIEISDRFSLVELPEDVVDHVISALRATKVKGKRHTVRRDLAKGRH